MIPVTIILCTYNRAASLRSTLEAIDGVHVPADMWCELLIIDDGSTDDTKAVACGFRPSNGMQARYIHPGKVGKSNALNRGLAEAKGDLITFLDDDVVPPAGWLRGICGPLLDGRGGAVAGGVELAPHLYRPWMDTPEMGAIGGITIGLDPGKPSRMLGASMAITREVLAKVPAFDPELGPGALGFAEDTLYSLQVKEAGFRIVGAFDVPVVHHFSAARLEPDYRIRAAMLVGLADAYLAHHWEHVAWPRPKTRTLTAEAQWALRRATRALRGGEVTEGTLEVARRLAAYRRYLYESKRPRNYEKRGLVKIGTEISPPVVTAGSAVNINRSNQVQPSTDKTRGSATA